MKLLAKDREFVICKFVEGKIGDNHAGKNFCSHVFNGLHRW